MWMTSEPTFWMPSAAATQAEVVDLLYYFLYYVSVASFVVIMVVLVYFIVKYKAKSKGERAQSPGGHNTLLEISWTIPPAIVSVFVFVVGAKGYIDMKSPPRDSMEIGVTAYKWAWQFTYPNGHKDANLHVPPDTPVRLVMSSDDVLHSFYVPSFRIKQDVVPGRYTEVWFKATESGEYQIFCTEYCGTKHSEMLAKVTVHESEDAYEKWLDSQGNILDKLPPDEAGAKLVAQNGCTACHSLDGKKGVGPSFKGTWGQERAFADGTNAVMDENYVRNSILNPQGQVVKGYAPVMPTFQGKLSDRQIDAIIAYLKTLKE